jgi:2-dehydropantoate 2-reductase
MRICIVGAGAIGGFLGARLAATGRHAVSAYARGETLAALRMHGWRLKQGDALIQAPAHAASDDAKALGVQELVFIALKAQALPSLTPALAPLIGPQTCIVPAMNGVPWWFCDGLPQWRGGALRSVDPLGDLARDLPTAQLLGAVVHASAAVTEPGLVAHRMGQRLIVGEPAGGTSQRSTELAQLLREAGFEAEASADIRKDIWFKLWGNLTMNPVSMLCHASADRILSDPLVRGFCSAVMLEAAQIGAHIGCPITQSPEDRHRVTEKLGAFKTSMLQDAEAGRAIELDAIVAAVQEIGQRLGLPTPNIDTLLGLTRLSARSQGLYPQG